MGRGSRAPVAPPRGRRPTTCSSASACGRTSSAPATRTSFAAVRSSASTSHALSRSIHACSILDEAVSALDKSVEAQVLNLLSYLKRQYNLTYIFISHDLNIVQYIADRVMVMYLGKVVEIGPSESIYRHPKHPYTRALLDSRLAVDPVDRVDTAPLTGDPPNPIALPSGCRFRTRCQFAEEICATRAPQLDPSPGRETHLAACHMADPASGHTKARRDPSTSRPAAPALDAAWTQ